MVTETKDTKWPQHSVENALLCMWSVNQDHATQLNGVGYNKLDSDFGNSLAEKLTSWGHLTFRQRSAAYRMLRRYRGQLMRNWGIDYEQIPAPTEEGGSAAPTQPGMLWLHGEHLIVDSPYNAKLVNALRVLPTRRWHKHEEGEPTSRIPGNKGVWTVPLTIDNFAPLKLLVEEFKLVCDPEALAAMNSAEAVLTEAVEASKAKDADLDVPGLGVTLLPFQKAAVAYARRVLPTGGLYIADEMGLGKTVENLAITQDQNAFPALIGVPNVVWLNWGSECRKVLPGRSVALLAPRSLSRSERQAIPEGVEVILLQTDEDTAIRSLLKPDGSWYDLYVVTYDNLLKWSKALMEVPWKMLTYDEAHLLKERSAKRTKAATELAKLADNVICMSGTPIPNAPAELITQLNILNRLDALGGFKRYWYRYCQGYNRGHANEGELNLKMRSAFYARRTKADIYPELPAVRWVPVPVAMNNAERYAQIENDLLHFIREKVEKDKAVVEFLATIEDLDARMAAKEELIDQKYETSMRAQVLALINALRQTVAQEKMPAFYRWLDSWLETTTGNGHSLEGERSKKIIVFTYHREIGEAIRERYGAPLIYGGMDKGRKKQVEQDFQENPATRVLVCAIKAAGLGLTLTAASDVAFLEFDWRPLDMDQAVSRTYGRVNDLHGATAYEIRATGTIDDMMLGRIAQKRDVTGKVSDGDSVFAGVMKDLLDKARG